MAPKRQRTLKKNQDHQSKMKKRKLALNQVELAPNVAVGPIQITDINDDCLEHIFNYLSLVDLLNLSDVSKRFDDAIELSLKSGYDISGVELKDITPRPRKQLIDGNKYYTSVYGLTTCLKFLRCFGHKIETLEVDYKKMEQVHCAEVDRYINEYCNEMLNYLYLYNAKPYSMNNITKEFPNVSFVEFHNCELGPQLFTTFKKWFPEVFSLSFYGVNKLAASKQFAHHIPGLSDLSVELTTTKEQKGKVGITEIATMLRVNPQIEKLAIRGKGWNVLKLESIIEDLKNIRSFDVRFEHNFFNVRRGDLHLKNIEHLEISDSSPDKFPRIALSFDHLKTLTISINSTVNHHFIHFISQQKSLQQLTLTLCSSEQKNAVKDMVINHPRLQKVLHSLQHLSLNCKYSEDEVLLLLSEYKMLKRFYFQLDVNSKVDSLKKRLPAEWQEFKNNGKRIHLFRKPTSEFESDSSDYSECEFDSSVSSVVSESEHSFSSNSDYE